MFSVKQKREISEAVQKILRATDHPELPDGEIQFLLHVDGEASWSWADIRNNGAVPVTGVNPWNEAQDKPAAQGKCECSPLDRTTGGGDSCVKCGKPAERKEDGK